MSMVEVVDNPRKGRRGRGYSAKQRRAGFAGKRAMSGRGRRRRRNPALATLANPRRRRARRRYGRPGRRYRRRRNPALFKGVGLAGFDFGAALWVGIGAFGSKAVPTLIKRFWPAMPTVGVMGYLTRIGGTMATGMAVKMLTKSTKSYQMVMAGGLGMIVLDLLREYVAPRLGLGGLGQDEGLVRAEELVDIYGAETGAAVSGYVDTEAPARMEGYVDWLGATG